MKTMLATLFLVFALVALWLLQLNWGRWFAPLPDSYLQTSTLTGHRGAAGYAPENTLASVRKALEIGVQRIEIDVQQTADSVVVVLHDQTLDRTTNGVGLVRQLTWAQVQGLDAGSKFDAQFAGEPIPSLDQVLELIQGRSTLLIEIKDGGEFYPNIEENILESIRRYQAESWVIIHSFNDLPLFKVHRLAPHLRLHKLFVAKAPWLPVYYDTRLASNDLQRYPFVQEFSFYHKFLSPSLVRRVHELGKKINVWTPNDSLRIQQMLHMGVDGIITDYPLLQKHLPGATSR